MAIFIAVVLIIFGTAGWNIHHHQVNLMKRNAQLEKEVRSLKVRHKSKKIKIVNRIDGVEIKNLGDEQDA